jgi:hypothetical protein
MAEPDNIVLERLRQIRGAIDDVRDNIREIKQRMDVRIQPRLDLTDA